jgi:hypothetical protein
MTKIVLFVRDVKIKKRFFGKYFSAPAEKGKINPVCGLL